MTYVCIIENGVWEHLIEVSDHDGLWGRYVSRLNWKLEKLYRLNRGVRYVLWPHSAEYGWTGSAIKPTATVT